MMRCMFRMIMPCLATFDLHMGSGPPAGGCDGETGLKEGAESRPWVMCNEFPLCFILFFHCLSEGTGDR
jgi:hypothetical protein